MTRTIATTRVAGRGLTFAGGAATDNVLFALAANTTDQPLKSVACWAKFNSAGGGSGSRLLLYPGSVFVWQWKTATTFGLSQTATGNGSWAYTANQLFGAWHHYALTYDRSGGTPLAGVPILYIDGVAVAWTTATQPTGTITADSVKNFIVGNNATSGGIRALDGPIAAFYVYNRILSPAEIVNLYNQVDPSATSLVLKCQFGEGSGLVTVDQSTNHMKGVIVGATWATTPIPIQRTAASTRTVAAIRSLAV